METILRSAEMAEIMLVPVRHHSPACSFHIKKIFAEWRPDAVLVEGPDNANALLPVMVHKDTRAPFAIYYAYHDKAKKISEEQQHYKCYYPFLDYSPELAALREADKNMTYMSFIDLSYGDILAASAEKLTQGEAPRNYNDDYLLARNDYMDRLCEKTGLRSFDEFWEKYFEINGIYEDSALWFSHLNTYCALARESTPEEALQSEGCLAREQHMAARIALQVLHGRAAAGGKKSGSQPHGGQQGSVQRILVVTGGFHTPGLRERLSDEQWQETVRHAKNIEHYVPGQDESVYLMPYSMESADALNGYASGMPYTGFYQKIWEGIACQIQNPYEEAVLDFLIAAGKAVRREDGVLSAYDEICAWQMAQGLCSLRGKPQPGAYELQDAVLSSYVKGECTLSSDMPLRALRRLMTGTGAGALCTLADVPPIILDFQDQCRILGIKTDSTLEKEVTLSIFSSKKHRRMSTFFHRLVFLQTEFAKRLKGPNLQLRRDRSLIREIWKYKYSAQVFAALIDVSVHGATLEEAVVSIVQEQLLQDTKADRAAVLLTQVFEMGISSQLEKVYGRVHELMLKDMDFYSIADALKSLTMMEDMGALYESELRFDRLLHIGVRKLITLLPSITRMNDDALNDGMNALKLLYQITGRKGQAYDSERADFYEVLQQMQEDVQIHAGLNGCIHGILYGGGREDAQAVGEVCRGYLTGTKEQLLKTAVFFRGLFFTAKDLMLMERRMLEMIDVFLGQVDEADFMELLPQLRMAFAYFTPAETDKIAQQAAGLHHKTGRELMERAEVLPEWYAYGKELDTYARNFLGTKK
ncbi:MAG: hypothetical protein K2O40_05660 [Lachnospiraceae bacterium]|nr:hypothetical protein [Lachnospiraceae bacterium]